MTKSVEMAPGKMFAVSDKVILVREYESVIGMLSSIGKPDGEDQLGYMMTFKGKLNNRERSGDVTVMMSPEDAMNHAMQIINGLEWLVKTMKENNGG